MTVMPESGPLTAMRRPFLPQRDGE
jgi:hypothetical protein